MEYLPVPSPEAKRFDEEKQPISATTAALPGYPERDAVGVPILFAQREEKEQRDHVVVASFAMSLVLTVFVSPIASPFLLLCFKSRKTWAATFAGMGVGWLVIGVGLLAANGYMHDKCDRMEGRWGRNSGFPGDAPSSPPGGPPPQQPPIGDPRGNDESFPQPGQQPPVIDPRNQGPHPPLPQQTQSGDPNDNQSPASPPPQQPPAGNPMGIQTAPVPIPSGGQFRKRVSNSFDPVADGPQVSTQPAGPPARPWDDSQQGDRPGGHRRPQRDHGHWRHHMRRACDSARDWLRPLAAFFLTGGVFVSVFSFRKLYRGRECHREVGYVRL